MRRLIQYGVTLLGLLFCVMNSEAVVEATETDSSSERAGFYYRVELPDNQINKNVGYFDLMMEPKQQQIVKINFTNPSQKDVILSIELNGAKTNQNGVLEYGPSRYENDASLKNDFVDIVKAPEEIIVPSGETIPLEIAITMPEDLFDGAIAGGIRFQVKEESDPNARGVVQKTAYLVGMLLRESETIVEPNLKLNEVYPELDNYRGAIYVNYSNIAATFVEDMTVEAFVTSKDKPDEVLFDSKTSGMSMAPNTYITYPISMGGRAYKAGDYIADILVTSDGKEWKWQQEFTITEKQANEFNEQNISVVQEKGFDWKWIAIIAGSVFLFLILIYLIIHFNNKKRKRITRNKKLNPARF